MEKDFDVACMVKGVFLYYDSSLLFMVIAGLCEKIATFAP